MDFNAQKEKFSDAYLQAVTAVAGFSLAKPNVDSDSIDWMIISSGEHGTSRRPEIGVQLKCTANSGNERSQLNCKLKLKNYEDLRIPFVFAPRILVVMQVPDKLDNWLHQTENKMVIKHCAYWLSLRGYPPTANTDTVTVQVPRYNMFTPEALRNIMIRINETGAI